MEINGVTILFLFIVWIGIVVLIAKTIRGPR